LSQTLRVLVIDDNPDDRLLAIRQLEREFDDLDVEQINNPAHLEQAINAGKFDLVITDYQLQWTNGIAVIRRIKEQYPDCPVIMFTNSGDEEVAVEAMKAGLDDYIIKSPKHYIRLARAARSVMERVWQRLALKEYETRYRRLFEGVPVGLYRTTATWEIKDANSAMAQMLGYLDPQSLLGVKLVDLYVNPQARELWEAEIQQQGVVRNFEVQICCSNGSIIWVLNSARAVTDSKLQILYYEGAIEDITERKRIEAEREQLLKSEQAARESAEAANRIKDEFLATLSHELRTPLNAILGWARMLHSRQLDQNTTIRGLEVIERNAVAQTNLINDLLDISKIISGKSRLEIREVDLGLIINTAIDSMQPAAAAKNIQLNCTIDDVARIYKGDVDKLQQVMWNLLSNAIKFTPSGGNVEVELSLSTKSKNQVLEAESKIAKEQSSIASLISHAGVEIRVSDTGLGISAEFLPYIFERFRQVDSSITRSHGGLGLGLAIVRHLVELHGGTVFAESAGLGKGATFIVKLPLLAETMILGEEKAELPNFESMPVESLKGLRLLVVDDDIDSRDLVSTILEQEGAEVILAASVREALAVLDKSHPDVLISDIGMPVEDGYALIRQIRNEGVLPGIPAIALTAYTHDLDRQKVVAAGFQWHLSKPVDPNELIVLVATITGRSVKL
jgi:PAS domain S-box-containing protein